MEINFTPNSAKYVCNVCDVNCCKKSDWIRHINTIKHCHRVNGNKTESAEIDKSAQYKCACGKKFVTNSGLWKHNKVCTISSSAQLLTTDSEEKNIDKNDNENLINYLIKENQEFKNLILEIVKKDTYTTNTTTNNTNSHNKAFNLNFFLNETCKDAMNIMDFVDSIQYQLSDLEKMGEIGYVEGLSNIIVKNLNALDVTQRPVHCTDKKRETIYIKDQDKWEKDEDKNKIRRAIKRAALKNARLIQKFKEKHPDYNEYHSKYSTQYHKLIIESFGGSGDNDVEKEDKIIRNISKNIVVDK
jgi:hypothetical protein